MLRYGFLLVVALVVLGIDQATKQWAHETLLGQPPLELLPVFSLALVYNQGAAFGFLNDAGGWQHYFFVSLAAVFSIVLMVWMWRERSRNVWLAVSLSLVLSGAVGNLVDRLRNGYVVDFLLVHYGSWSFPVFNVADIAITIGAIMLIMDSLLFSRR